MKNIILSIIFSALVFIIGMAIASWVAYDIYFLTGSGHRESFARMVIVIASLFSGVYCHFEIKDKGGE